MIDAVAARDPFEDVGDVVLAVSSASIRDVLANSFLDRVAENALSAAIPAANDAIQVLADNRVVGGLDDGGEMLPKRLIDGKSLPEVSHSKSPTKQLLTGAPNRMFGRSLPL